MMPILARFRQVYEQASIPMGRVCLRLGLTPDMLTYLSLALSVLAGYVIAQGELWWGVAVILLVGFAGLLVLADARRHVRWVRTPRTCPGGSRSTPASRSCRTTREDRGWQIRPRRSKRSRSVVTGRA